MIAVIFEVWPAEGERGHYLELAAALRADLERSDGFISVERFESLTEPGKLLWTDTHPDLTEGFHTYGVQITQTEVIVFFDRKEVQRMPLPRPKTVGKFFVLLDNAIHTDHGVDIPASGYADATFDYVRVWSAD